MELKCKINGNEYENVVAGESFADEYNETLDSGSLIITHQSFIEDLKPYDDVYIWDSKHNFQGYNKELIYFDDETYYIENYYDEIFGENFPYSNTKELERENVHAYTQAQLDSYVGLKNDSWSGVINLGELSVGDLAFIKVLNSNNNKEYKFKVKITKIENNLVYTNNYGYWERNNIFYKHLLVSNYSEKMINLRDLTQKNKGVGTYTPLYEYTIELFSEIKKLEVTQTPNISTTEPLNQKYKISSWQYMNQYIELYSPLYKKVYDESTKTWEFEKKYSLSPQLELLFTDVYPPDFSLNSPNLRDIFSKLMIAKDLIPIVKNDVIYALDITKRRGTFAIDEHINYVSGNMTSNDYCDNLRKQYSNAISQNTSSRTVEYIGFRNENNALMTLEDMAIETKFPIYKINKVYMCYYKKGNCLSSGQLSQKVFLCKQDITPLVKLNTERNVLSQDWNDLNTASPLTIEDMAKFKMCTVGYDIGSNRITGWGQRYTYPIKGTFWDITKNYIQQIFEKIDTLKPYGIYDVNYIKKQAGGISGTWFFDTANPLNNIAIPDEYVDNSLPLKLKTIIFEVDYQAFYNGTIIHTKDGGLDNITINDNPSSSLTLLEQDGIFTKEKINRFANKSVTINARYDDISQLQPLGSVFTDCETGDNDIIIYHREYQIWDNEVIATYYGIHDYVLKNYYTSVFARHRTWNLMPYNESVRRSENKRMLVLLSKNEMYFENLNDEDIKNNKFLIRNIYQNLSFFDLLFSAFKPQNFSGVSKDVENINKLNYAYIKYIDEMNNVIYVLSDLNSFTSGNVMAFNVNMIDNISGGNYISKFRPNFNGYLDSTTPSMENDLLNYILYKNVENDYTGSLQSWKRISNEFGFCKKIGFYLGCKSESTIKNIASEAEVKNLYLDFFNKLPYVDNISENSLTNLIGNDFDIYKDNKELIDMTYQIEPITKDDDIMFSGLLMGLSDLITNDNKFEETHNYYSAQDLGGSFSVYFGAYSKYVYGKNYADQETERRPYFIVKISNYLFSILCQATLNKFVSVEDAEAVYNLNANQNSNDFPQDINFYDISITSIKAFWDNGVAKIQIVLKENIIINPPINKSWIQYRTITLNETDKFILSTHLDNDEFSDKDDYHYFMFSEYPMAFVSEYATASSYNSFVACIDWSNDSSNSSTYNEGQHSPNKYDINSSYSASDNATALINSKCYLSQASISSGDFDKTWAKYWKNMFLVTSKSKLKKELVYDKYGFANDYDSQYSTYKINDIVLYQNEVYINKQSINSPENFDSSKWDKIIGAITYGHLYKITSNENYWQNIDMVITDKNVNDVIKVESNNSQSYIKIDLSSFATKPESVQYWYEKEGTLNFVFGVNVSDEEWENQEIKIYLSALTTRDTKVFDDKHNMIGNVLNLSDLDNVYLDVLSNGQYYDVPTEHLVLNINNNLHGIVKAYKVVNGDEQLLQDKCFVSPGDYIRLKRIVDTDFYQNITFEVNDTIINQDTYDLENISENIIVNNGRFGVELTINDVLSKIQFTQNNVVKHTGDIIYLNEPYTITAPNYSGETHPQMEYVYIYTSFGPNIPMSLVTPNNILNEVISNEGYQGIVNGDLKIDVMYENTYELVINDEHSGVEVRRNGDLLANGAVIFADNVLNIKYNTNSQYTPQSIWITTSNQMSPLDITNSALSNEGASETVDQGHIVNNKLTINVSYGGGNIPV